MAKKKWIWDRTRIILKNPKGEEVTLTSEERECLSQGSLSEYQIFVVREPRTVKRAYSSLKLIDAIKFLSQ
jgi:hypothetical protein